MRAAVLFVSLCAAAGCDQPKKSHDDTAPAAPRDPGKRVGIDPDRWTCDVLTTPAILSEALGAPARALDNNMPTPPGVPRPCTYVVETSPGHEEAWSYDLDCRDHALAQAEILFQQYADDSAAQLEAYHDASAGKPIKDPDGGILAPPIASFEVAVGRRGLDHHGNGLLFVDDDAPCYVRVVGHDAARRLTLAKLIAGKLTPATAPMRPRYIDAPPT
ncbi:MAG TPA: hypothetical protein VHE35_13805 [Kofleriaceae bacterium]|nr:hypothetical protein [Kofleriaceae bacterium]